jgi:haloalkane dehalogenase
LNLTYCPVFWGTITESIKNIKVWEKLKSWNKPFLTIFSDEDDIMRGAEKTFQKVVPGTKEQNHKIINAGHFIQEDQGKELAKLIIEFYKNNTANTVYKSLGNM